MLEILGGIALIVFASNVGRAIARRAGVRAPDDDIVRRVGEIEARLDQVDERLMTVSADSHDRMLEVEERLDFAERLLKQVRERDKLPPGP